MYEDNISLCKENIHFSKKYIDLDCFDYTVELTFGNTGHKDGFHGSNFWQVMHCTPFEETIYLDYDMLFVNVDIDLLWQQFSDYEVAMPVIAGLKWLIHFIKIGVVCMMYILKIKNQGHLIKIL